MPMMNCAAHERQRKQRERREAELPRECPRLQEAQVNGEDAEALHRLLRPEFARVLHE
jgi:hypothetical protein